LDGLHRPQRSQKLVHCLKDVHVGLDGQGAFAGFQDIRQLADFRPAQPNASDSLAQRLALLFIAVLRVSHERRLEMENGMHGKSARFKGSNSAPARALFTRCALRRRVRISCRGPNRESLCRRRVWPFCRISGTPCVWLESGHGCHGRGLCVALFGILYARKTADSENAARKQEEAEKEERQRKERELERQDRLAADSRNHEIFLNESIPCEGIRMRRKQWT